MTRSVEDSGLGSAAPAGDASDSGRAADRDTNAGATPAPTLPRCHTESEQLRALIRDLLADHQRIEPHHADMCQLCKRAAAALQG